VLVIVAAAHLSLDHVTLTEVTDLSPYQHRRTLEIDRLLAR
jgi:hypothetical protein